MHQNSHRSRRDIIASATDSLNRSRCVQSSSPQNVPCVRSSISTSCLVSPNHSRRQGQGVSVTGSGTRSTHGSRTGSPLTVTMPLENLQSINAAYSMSQTYLGEGLGNAIPSPNSPVYISNSPGHSRSNSVQSLLRGERDHYSGRTSMDRSVYSDRHTGYMRDRSLDRRDRSLDRHDRSHNRHIDMTERYNTYSGRERSLDREYVPHMGARSLEREHNNLVRSRSIDHEYINDQDVFFPSTPDSYHSKDTLILDLQTHIAQLNKECSLLRKDLESTKDKLSSSMNSIKTFWSPELKKERAMRKEESAKHQVLHDQIRLLQAEGQLAFPGSCLYRYLSLYL
ncbi:hypothetical protein NP493_1186g00011 [Ridgeia piscesae]|uniref:Uncharacterized protein n=1 Tax=Ridgeia piscesae TaxID=27915 RepID=A0AAD9KDY3_RIDPI|nr:hypothetical protein NP493_1186g00011 [Ridgeia piscesae]